MKPNKPVIFFLTACFIVSALPYASAFFTADEPAPQQITNVSKTMVIGDELSFSEQDILSGVSNISDIDGIILCALPDPKIGVLKFGTRDLLLGEAVTVEGIDALKFIPSSTTVAKAEFSCIPVYKSGKTHAAVNVSINVLSEKNHAPSVKDVRIKTAKNIAINGVFSASDPENDALTYSITEQPKLGQVEVCLDAPNKFLYTPYQNKTGKDSFKYIATDKHGNTSAPATVTVEINRSRVKLTYADMQGNGMHYQAIALAENGIFKGETIGDQNFLHPTRPVTRSEFIAMTVALFEDLDMASAVSSTGFADDSSTPVWAKPAIVAAVNAGIINGCSINGQQYLRPQDIITRGEAAVILNNALAPESSQAAPTFADSSSIPTWAKQATANVAALDIMNHYADHTIRPTVQLTRQDAVELIYNAMCAKE